MVICIGVCAQHMTSKTELGQAVCQRVPRATAGSARATAGSARAAAGCCAAMPRSSRLGPGLVLACGVVQIPNRLLCEVLTIIQAVFLLVLLYDQPYEKNYDNNYLIVTNITVLVIKIMFAILLYTFLD